MPPPAPTARLLRTIIHGFINGRLAEKRKGKSDDEALSLAEKYDPDTWLKDASRRASQLTLVTHAPKFSHSDSKSDGARFDSSAAAAPGLVTSAGCALSDDVFGNAAALDVFKFLQLSHEAETLISRIFRDDVDMLSALSDERSTAHELVANFKAIARPTETPACDTYIKQIYFPLEGDTYHLLGILHPTSLAHRFHELIQHDKFSEEAKAARESHKAWKKSPKAAKSSTETGLPEKVVILPAADSYRVYPDLALRKFGGSKPQNVSQLNSERGGRGYLLASLPPTWNSRPLALPIQQATLFGHSLAGQLYLRKTFSRLKAYYRIPYGNAALRDWADEQIAEIIGKVMDLADRTQQAEPGWSIGSRLDPAETAWLDPDRELVGEGGHAVTDWREIVASRFANWLNFHLSDKATIMNQEVAGEWHRRFLKELSTTH